MSAPSPSVPPLTRLRQALPPWPTLTVLGLAIAAQAFLQLGPIFKWDGWMASIQKWNLWNWYIEDAAITFSYSRNLVEGDGLVAFRGGERIEGYSNPSWMLLMAMFHVVGIDPWWSSKLMALGMGAVTVVLAWRIAQEVLDDRDSPAALVAPIVLALYPQFIFWHASGLENPMFTLCLAGGVLAVLVEARTGGFPFSAVWFLLLAVTRPEGILYAAWGGFVFLVLQTTRGRGLRTTWLWLATFFLPFIAYNAVRYSYFAWAFPNTYYAKLGDKEFRPFAWTARGWKYIRGWASGTFDESGKEGTGLGWFLPVFLSAMLPLRSWRALAVPAVSVVLAVLFLFPSSDLTNTWSWWPKDIAEPTWWREFRVWAVAATALVVPISRIGAPKAGGRILLWGMALITLFFCILSGGDWMRGYRWMSFLAVPMAVMFAVGVDEIAQAAQRAFDPGAGRRWTTPAWSVAPLLVLALVPCFFFHLEFFFGKRETGPYSVHERVKYTDSIQRKLFLEDELVRNLDVDMGAHTWWSNHLMVDMAGLIDVTVAHHNFGQRAVTKEYIFEEQRPHLAHVHGGWANSSKIPTFTEWKNNYVSIPGFPTSPKSKTYHMGNHVRRDLLMLPQWKGVKARRVALEQGAMLHGWRIVSPEVTRGKAFFVEVGVQVRAEEERRDLRLLGFVSDDQGRLQVFDLPLGYDWLPTSEWRNDEIFWGKYAVTLRDDLEPGTYDIGFVLMDDTGHVLQPLEADREAVEGGPTFGGYGAPPRFVPGEVRFGGALQIGEPGFGEKAARDDFEKALELGRTGSCVDAEHQWWLARAHLPKATSWQEQHRDELRPVFAACWIDKAQHEEDDDAAASLARARFWDRHAPGLQDAADVVGGRLMQAGEEARERGDWQLAYQAFSKAVTANPSLSWARRYAEEARDHRLKIDDESVAKAKEEREARQAEAKATKAEAEDAPATPPRSRAADAPEQPAATRRAPDAPEGEEEPE